MKKRNTIIHCIHWIIALAISFICVNFFAFFYETSPGWIERNKAATFGIWNPHSTIIHGSEGYGIYKVDSRGYVNPDRPLAERYCLLVGASHTQGKEVMPGNRYVDILNKKFNAEEENLFYTVSQDGFYLPEIIKCFGALISEFPDSDSIVLETGTTKFTNEEWLDALNQVDYDENELGCVIIDQLSLNEKISISIKEKIPLLSIIKKQISQIINETDAEQTEANSQPYTSEQIKNVEAAIKLLRKEYSGNLYILYHPPVSINEDGTLCIKKEVTLEQFCKVCSENNIVFIDMTDAFYREYKDCYLLPYGFNNTSMGKGHINKYGHRLVADAIYNAMEGGER